MGEKKSSIVWLIFFSVLLGVLLSFQMKQNIDDYDLVSLKSIQIMKNDINNMNKEIEDIKELIIKKEKELEELEELINNEETDISEHLLNGIKEIKLIAGLEDVQGPGVRVLIADNEDEDIVGAEINEDIIHDADIQILLNDLRKAGAEAISINGQRVMSRSEIKCAGPTIRVNGRSSANPFIITAIGDPKLLYAAINAPNTYGWQLREIYKLRVEAIIKDNVYVPRYYWTDQEFKYAKPKKEGE